MTNNTTIANLFSTGNSQPTGGNNQLNKTAQLTSQSLNITNTILSTIEASGETYRQSVVDSQASHDAMDKLISSCYDLTTVNIEYLKSESIDTLDKMLKSQQSKRSRSKSKQMTLDNYKTMMTGAVAENLLRLAMGKDKSAGGFRGTDIAYSDEDIKKYTLDQEALAKEIRNVQSKKSIAKSKADFDETSVRWQQLLDAEQLLKSLRIGGSTKASETNSKITSLIADLGDINQLKSADAKSILQQIAETLKG